MPQFSAKNGTLILLIILVSYFMIILDVSIVLTGLPQIRDDLGFSAAQLSWVQSAYTLIFGGFLLLGARAGDLLGRRFTFQLGLGVFTLASVVIGLSQTASQMVVARSIQGIGAAILAPSTLALISTTFEEGRERTVATAWYGSIAGLGASVGLVIGGVLADLLSWRVGFFINLPVGIVMAVLGRKYIEETGRQSGQFDLFGAITSTLGFGALVWGIVDVAERGVNLEPVLVALVGLLVIAVFIFHESRAKQPIMPLSLFRHSQRVGAYLARFLFIGAMSSFFFFTTQLLQEGFGFSPLQAGLGFLPMTVINFFVAMRVPRMTDRWGGARLMHVGIALTAAGMFWLSLANTEMGYWLSVALPMVLIGIGQGLCFAPLTSFGIIGTNRQEAGAASGLVNVSHQIGMSFGLASLVAVAAFSTKGLPDADSLSPAEVMVHGADSAFLAGTVLLVLAFVAVLLLIPHRKN